MGAHILNFYNNIFTATSHWVHTGYIIHAPTHRSAHTIYSKNKLTYMRLQAVKTFLRQVGINIYNSPTVVRPLYMVIYN